jgi:3-methyladenine DNA glycosylase AlkD
VTTSVELDLIAEVNAIRAALEANADPAYRDGMRRTVPSQHEAHAVRVPVIRKLAVEWLRAHKTAPGSSVLDLANALWETAWREERIVAMTLLGRRKDIVAGLDWSLIEGWSKGIDNWEHVDNMASLLTGPVLVARPELVLQVQDLAASEHVWQRRLALVTLIEVVRDDSAWLPDLRAVALRLKGDRGPTMRKALDWARRTVDKLEAH